eukprot:2058991-Pleurochrysis_carterae.AAC.1
MYASTRLAWSFISRVGNVSALASMPIVNDSPGRPHGVLLERGVDVMVFASCDLVARDELRRRRGIIDRVLGEGFWK